MSSETQLKSIAELYGEFRLSYKDVVFYRKLNETMQSIEAEKIATAEAKFTALRAQLLERIPTECGIDISPVLKYIVRVPECGLSPSACRDHAAALNFLAWEIEQREKEVNNGN